MANTMMANTNTQIQRSEQEQSLNDPLAFCEQRPAVEEYKYKYKHKYTNPKRWAGTIAEWPVGFLWAAPCCWVHLSQASGRRIFNATQILYCPTNSTNIQCAISANIYIYSSNVPYVLINFVKRHNRYAVERQQFFKFYVAVQMLQIFNVPCHIFKEISKKWHIRYLL